MSAGFLLDTNVPSELTNLRPTPRVVDWVQAQDYNALYFSVISVGELRKGMAKMPRGRRRTELEVWLASFLLPLFEARLLPVTLQVADRWGVLDAERQRKGKPLATADGLIVATAIEHDLTLVTRNEKDFADLGAAILNPWNVPAG